MMGWDGMREEDEGGEVAQVPECCAMALSLP